jgi:large-conductance mechanosensitive channel
VAFILGGAFNAVVQSLATDMVMAPMRDGCSSTSCPPGRSAAPGSAWVLSNLVGFVLVATLLFFVVRAVSRMRQIAPEDSPVPESDEVVVLRGIREELRAVHANRRR